MPVLCITSPKGGAGKTTLAANVAYELARNGARVVALDTDPQNALLLHFGLPVHDSSGLVPELRARRPWQSVLRHTRHGVHVLPYGRVDLEDAIAFSAMLGNDPAMLGRTVHEILSDPDTVLVVDTPPGPSRALSALLPLTDFLVTVLLADAASVAVIPSIEQGRAYGQIGEGGRSAWHGYVLNQVNPLSRLARASGESIKRHLQERLLGTISRDELVAEAVACQQPLATFSSASRAGKDIALVAAKLAERLAGVDRRAAPPTGIRQSFFAQFGFGSR
jgi:cellulose synthase operon protein YhjQ